MHAKHATLPQPLLQRRLARFFGQLHAYEVAHGGGAQSEWKCDHPRTADRDAAMHAAVGAAKAQFDAAGCATTQQALSKAAGGFWRR